MMTYALNEKNGYNNVWNPSKYIDTRKPFQLFRYKNVCWVYLEAKLPPNEIFIQPPNPCPLRE